MAQRHNHYEQALAAWLREERIPYVAVDERRRALADDGSLKSADFLIASPTERGEARWVVDVKGRRFPSGLRHPQYWRNWTTRDDLDSLARWAERLGPGCEPLLVFAYELVADRSPTPPELVFAYRERAYAFVAAPLAAYRASARTLSPSWGTVAAPVAAFRRIAQPLGELLMGSAAAQASAWETEP